MLTQKNPTIEVTSPGVNIAVVKKDDDGWRFLLVRRSDAESYPGCWGLVTGSKASKETAAQTTVRELREETGLSPLRLWSTEYLIQFYEPEFDAIWILPLIVAVVAADSQVKLSPENSEFRWLEANQARKLVSWRNLVKVIDDVSEELEVYPARNWVEIKA